MQKTEVTKEGAQKNLCVPDVQEGIFKV